MFENVPITICQRTNNDKKIGYGQHSFLLLELEKRYVISVDGKSGVTMREAINFSQVGNRVFRTVKQPSGYVLETIRIFETPQKFGRSLDMIPTKELEIA